MEVSTAVVLWTFGGIAALFGFIVLFASFFTVQQGTIAVISRFGKYRRIAAPGLNWKNPFIDKVFTSVSTQNRSEELKFQAITSDQANVHFVVMILYAVKNATDDIVHRVAYKFANQAEFTNALNRTIEGTVRSLIAGKKQQEILTLRREIVEYVKTHIDDTLEEWGYHVIDVQVNDIAFDAEITQSMARVVSSSNLKAAAENEGAALLITKTKGAEAEGRAIIIQAESEKQAAKLRGEGVAEFRKAVAGGIADSAQELKEQGLGQDVIMMSMWIEGIKNFAEVGRGNVIFLDGSVDGYQRMMAQMQRTAPVSNGKAYAAVNTQ